MECIFRDGSQVVANGGALDGLFVVSWRINRNIGGVRFDLFFFDARADFVILILCLSPFM